MMENKLKRSQSSGQFLHLNLDKPVIKSDYYPPKRNSLVQMPELMTSAKSAGEANFPSKKAMLLRSTTQAASEGIGTFAKNFVISEDVEVSSISSSLKTGEITGTARSNNKTDGKLHLPPIFPASKNTEFDRVGSYEYDNKFFKYEGQWKNGKKHGTGKLTFQDGSYYEGTFVGGEITGFGTRYFAVSGCKYQGQFVKGEFHGKGRMLWPDGSIYEGQWENNRRQGFGVMKSVKENCMYKGSYVMNKRQGQGTMIYPKGDRYDGDWLNDMRNGDGDMKFVDGTVYEGQFVDDSFNGEGVMRHCSGLMYRGLWFNGNPTVLPSRIVIITSTGKDCIEVVQGQPFNISIQCVDSNGTIIEADSGREIRISAGFKHLQAKKGTAIFDLIEEYEEKPMNNPYYPVLQYPLTDFLAEEEKAEEDLKEENDDTFDDQEPARSAEDDPKDTPSLEEGGEGKGETEGEGGEQPNTPGDRLPTAGEGTLERQNSIISIAETTISMAPEAVDTKDSRPLPPPVANKRTEKGLCEWTNIMLAPAPPRFPPFVAMDEEERKIRARQDKQDGLKNRKQRSVIGLIEAKRMKRLLPDERFARIGEYVLMMHDITSPPFMEQTLEPAFILVKHLRPKREKKPKEVKPKQSAPKSIIESSLKEEDE